MISIIIPIYNAEPFIAECLDSVLKQTYKNIEVLAVNDGSTDGSDVLLEAYSKRDSRLKVITKPNGGVSSARNSGLNQASGEFVTFIDADDYWTSANVLERLYALAVDNNADFVYAGHIDIFDDDRKTATGEEVAASLANSGGHMAMDWIPLIRLDLIRSNDFSFDERYKYGEDPVFLFFCLIWSICCAELNECHYHYRKHPASAMHQTTLRVFDAVDGFIELHDKSVDYPYFQAALANIKIPLLILNCIQVCAIRKFSYSSIMGTIRNNDYDSWIKNCDSINFSNKARKHYIIYKIHPFVFYILVRFFQAIRHLRRKISA